MVATAHGGLLKNKLAEGFRPVWPMGSGYGTTVLGTLKACPGRCPSRILRLRRNLVTPLAGGDWVAWGAAGAKIMKNRPLEKATFFDTPALLGCKECRYGAG